MSAKQRASRTSSSIVRSCLARDVTKAAKRQASLAFVASAVSAVSAAVLQMAYAPQAQAQAPSSHPVPTTDSPSSAQHYAIAGGPLAPALRSFASHANVLLSFTEAQVAGMSTQGISGSFTAEAALAHLLSGTGLQAVQLDHGGYVLRADVTASSTQTAAAPGALPEVLVTAASQVDVTSEGSNSYAARGASVMKGAQSLREIPQSVSVVTRQRMDDQNLTSVTEALRSATGVSTSGYFEQETPAARGFNMNEQHDGLAQQGGSSGLAPDLAIYDRVEILRGASGLLSGSGDAGGTINYVRKRPQAELAVTTNVSIGSWNNYRGELDLNLPALADGALRTRLVGAYQQRDFYYDVADNRRKTLYGALEYDLTPSTTLGVFLTHLDRDGLSFWGLPTYTNGEFIESRSAFVGLDRNYSMQVKEVAADLKHEFANGWQAKLAVARRSHIFDGYGAYNSSGGVDPVTLRGSMAVGKIESENHRESAEINFSGPIEVLGRKHTVNFGYSRARQDYDGGSTYQTVADVDLFQEHDFGGLVPESVATKNQTLTTQSGWYGLARIQLADPLTLVLGGRWSDYASKSRRTWPEQGAWTAGVARADNEFTPYGGLIWDFSPQMSAYASYADIFVPQTQRDVSDNVLQPRVGWQSEIGVKGEFFDGALNASLAAFRIRDKNRAMVDSQNIGCGGTATGTCYVAAGLAQTQGWETELSGSPMKNLDLSLGYTYMNTKYLRDTNAANIGKRFNTNTPRHLLKLWGNYRLANHWRLGVGVHAQSQTYFGTTTATVKRREQSSYATASLVVGYQPSRHWDASLKINNVFDKRYFEMVSGTGFANIYGEPRNFNVSLRYSF